MKRALLILLVAASQSLAAGTNTLFTITAYCHCAKCCGLAGQPTASGKQPVAGVTVAGPRRIPLGTRVHIDGLGDFTVQDRLAKRFDHRFDVFMADHKSALKFGRRQLHVTILK
jgi:3D (Asp-Asp-Asp) domain-containing protein